MGVKPPATPLQIQYYSFWYPGCKRTKRHRAMLTRAAVRHDDPLQSVAVHIDAAREQLERASEVVAHARQRVLVPGQCQKIMLSCRVQANKTMTACRDLVAMEPATIQRVEFHVTPWCLQPMEPRWKELLRTAHGKLGRQPRLPEQSPHLLCRSAVRQALCQ